VFVVALSDEVLT